MQARIIDLDVWGNGEEGYDINNFFPGPIIDIDESGLISSDALIVSVLNDHYFLNPITAARLNITWLGEIMSQDGRDSGHVYSVESAEDGKPIVNVELYGE